MSLTPFSTQIQTKNMHGQWLDHTFMSVVSIGLQYTRFKIDWRLQCEAYVKAMKSFHRVLEKTPPSISFFSISRSELKGMTTHTFQRKLRRQQIIIPDLALPEIPCTPGDLTMAYGLRRKVYIEGKPTYPFTILGILNLFHLADQSTAAKSTLEKRSVKQFIDNLEGDKPNILRIVRMTMPSGFESTLFSTDYAAWLDMLEDRGSTHEDTSKESALRWTDVLTTNTVQFWRIAPAGFGAYFNVRSGQQWVIMATNTPYDGHNEDNERATSADPFSHWGRYLDEFNRFSPDFSIGTRVESIQLEAGDRL